MNVPQASSRISMLRIHTEQAGVEPKGVAAVSRHIKDIHRNHAQSHARGVMDRDHSALRDGIGLDEKIDSVHNED